MNEIERQRISNNYEFLVTKCKSDILLPRLKKMMDIPNDEYTELKQITDRKEQCRQLLFFLMDRGPNTYDKLINALMETNQYTVLQCLEPNSVEISNIPAYERDQQRCNRVFREPSHYSSLNVTTQDEPLDILVKLGTNFDYEEIEFKAGMPYYNTTSRNRGLIKIINIKNFVTKKERVGSEVDVKNLESLFTQIGFQVDVHDNLNEPPTKENIINSIKSFVNDDRLIDADIAMLFLMSHGGQVNERDYIYSCNEEKIFMRSIEKFFNNDKCKRMQNKPKLLFVQACRGKDPDYGSRNVETDGTPPVITEYIPTNTDLLTAYSTCPETASHRDTIMGTWFIYWICLIFMNHSFEKDIESMLKMVYEKLKHERTEEGSMQAGEHMVRTFKKCYLNPGIYRDGYNIRFFNDR